MSDQFLAEIRIFPIDYAPIGWAFCEGQLIPISQNTALFSLLGTMYGGNGTSNFALPDLKGAAPMQQGPATGGLSQRFQGETSGSDQIVLLPSQIPAHTHAMMGDSDTASVKTPAGQVLGSGNAMYTTEASDSTLASAALATVGGNMPHNNMQPYLTLNFCIALSGTFPRRP